MTLREEVIRIGQTQGPRCAIARYCNQYPEDATDLKALVADEGWVATRLSSELLRVRGWRIPAGAVLKHRRHVCGCYQNMSAL